MRRPKLICTTIKTASITRSVIVSSEMVKIAKLEKQLRNFQEMVQRNAEKVDGELMLLKKCLEQSSRDNESLRDDLKAFMRMIMKEVKGKEVSTSGNEKFGQSNKTHEKKGSLLTPSPSRD